MRLNWDPNKVQTQGERPDRNPREINPNAQRTQEFTKKLNTKKLNTIWQTDSNNNNYIWQDLFLTVINPEVIRDEHKENQN